MPYATSTRSRRSTTHEPVISAAQASDSRQMSTPRCAVVGNSCSSAVGSGKPIGTAWRPPGSRGCWVSSLAVEPCATLADHPAESRLSAMPVVQHYSQHDRRAEVP
jgi:hypothetical protein